MEPLEHLLRALPTRAGSLRNAAAGLTAIRLDQQARAEAAAWSEMALLHKQSLQTNDEHCGQDPRQGLVERSDTRRAPAT